MRIFVAGATGVLGKRAVRELVAAGHEVTGVARTGEKAALLRSLGAIPVQVDIFDPAQSKWSYRAEPADILRTTQLPISADRFSTTRSSAATTCAGRSAEFWAAAMKGQNFRTEDRLNPDAFNSALWRGLGSGPEPIVRDARDLRKNRERTITDAAPCAFAD